MIELFLNGLQFKNKKSPWSKAYSYPVIQRTDRLVEYLYGKSVPASKLNLVKNAGCSVNLYGNRVYL